MIFTSLEETRAADIMHILTQLPHVFPLPLDMLASVLGPTSFHISVVDLKFKRIQ